MSATTDRTLVVGRNPDPDSRLPYLIRVPVDGGVVLKAREPWPTTSRVFCAEVDGPWPDDAEIIEELPVRSCRRRGIAIDLLLARSRLNRSQFVFTTIRNGRRAVFWQTPKTVRATKPGSRIPKRRASGKVDLEIIGDTRERYGYRFASQQATLKKQALRCGDYAVLGDDGSLCAVVERKSVQDLVASLFDGNLQFLLAELTEVPRAAVVVEGNYADLLRLEHVQAGFVLDLLARLQVRYPSVPISFAGTRKLAEEFTFRFLGASRADAEHEV